MVSPYIQWCLHVACFVRLTNKKLKKVFKSLCDKKEKEIQGNQFERHQRIFYISEFKIKTIIQSVAGYFSVDLLITH